MSKPEVIVVVSGGVVQGARATRPVAVQVLDCDDLRAAEKDPAAKEEFARLAALENRWKSLEFTVL